MAWTDKDFESSSIEVACKRFVEYTADVEKLRQAKKDAENAYAEAYAKLSAIEKVVGERLRGKGVVVLPTCIVYAESSFVDKTPNIYTKPIAATYKKPV